MFPVQDFGAHGMIILSLLYLELSSFMWYIYIYDFYLYLHFYQKGFAVTF